MEHWVFGGSVGKPYTFTTAAHISLKTHFFWGLFPFRPPSLPPSFSYPDMTPHTILTLYPLFTFYFLHPKLYFTTILF